jgi:hypothetical protein
MDWERLFVPWGLGWWLLTASFVVGSFALVAYKRGAYFLLSVLVYLALVQFLGTIPVLEFLELHYPWIIGLAGGFLVISVLWFNWRWHWLTAKMRGRYNDVFERWCHENRVADLPPPEDDSEEADSLRVQWEDYFKTHCNDEFGLIEFRPKFRKHKDAILTWMAAWPLDMMVWLFAEVLRDFWNMLYYRFQGILQAIMERNWRGTEGHMLTVQQRAAWEEAQRKKMQGLPVEPKRAQTAEPNAVQGRK